MSQIFNSENCINWWCLLLLMLLSFLIGYFLSKWLNGKSSKEALERCHDENKKLKLLGGDRKPKEEHANTTFTSKKIMAKKTMERSGKAVEKNDLDFSNFGKATASEKDDLKKISGVGPFIENKLNEIGIFTFEQVSKFSDEDIDNITNLIEFFPGRILRDDWRGQAIILKDGGKTDFSKRVDNNDVDYNENEKK